VTRKKVIDAQVTEINFFRTTLDEKGVRQTVTDLVKRSLEQTGG